MKAREFSETITIADQPTAEELAALPGQGYVGVVNLRNDGEPEQPLDTTAEGEKVREGGMDYLHYGVGSSPLSEAGVSEVREFLDLHTEKGKVLVHCRKGGRASAMVLLQQAKVQGWKPSEVLAKGEELGLKVEGGLRKLVEQYLAEQSE